VDILEKNIDAQNRELLESSRELMHWKDVAHNRVNSTNATAGNTPYSSVQSPSTYIRSSSKGPVQNLPLSQVLRSRNNTPVRDRVVSTTDISPSFTATAAVNLDDRESGGLNATQLVQDATNDLKDIMLALGLGMSK
jgi:hypothetical protein